MAPGTGPPSVETLSPMPYLVRTSTGERSLRSTNMYSIEGAGLFGCKVGAADGPRLAWSVETTSLELCSVYHVQTGSAHSPVEET